MHGALGLGGLEAQGPQCPGVGLSLEGTHAVTGVGHSLAQDGVGAGRGCLSGPRFSRGAAEP